MKISHEYKINGKRIVYVDFSKSDIKKMKEALAEKTKTDGHDQKNS